jgi:hypothetical protein
MCDTEINLISVMFLAKKITVVIIFPIILIPIRNKRKVYAATITFYFKLIEIFCH